MHTIFGKTPLAMRAGLSLLFATIASCAVARELFVVVHTSDALVVQYYCGDPESTSGAQPVLPVRVQSSPGSFQWHAVGGLAPYTAIRTERAGEGTYCVTVIDAAGNVATGCGVIQTFVQRKNVSCRTWRDDVPGQHVEAMPVPQVATRGTTTKPRVNARTGTPERPVQQPRERTMTRHGGMDRGGDRPGGTVVRATSDKPGAGGRRSSEGSSTRSGGTGLPAAPVRGR